MTVWQSRDAGGLLPWERRRTEFQHTRLKNEFLNRLGAFLVRLEQPSPSETAIVRFLTEDLSQWPALAHAAQDLIALFEEEMSPRVLLQTGRLTLLSEESRAWVGDVLDALWKARFPVRRWLLDARAALDDADSAYGRLASRLGPSSGSAEAQALRPDFEELYDLATKLSEAFSKFPHRIVLA